MKIVAGLFCGLAMLLAQTSEGVREGSFDIRFEPTAKLQTRVQVPFQITVKDARHQPLPNAKVTLQIGNQDPRATQIFPAPQVGPGIYLAKPIFPTSGEWSLYVQVERERLKSARTLQFAVVE